MLATGVVFFATTNPAHAAMDTEVSIDENLSAGIVVATIYRDGGAASYAVSAGNTGGAFTVVLRNNFFGDITVANSAALDYETNPNFSLEVHAFIEGSSNPAAIGGVTIHLNDVVEVVNTAPTAPEYAITVQKNANHTFAFSSVGASDLEGAVTLSTVDAISGTTIGTPTKEGGSAIRYVPSTDYEGNDSFTYTVSDSNGAMATGTIAVTVRQYRAPTAVDDPYSVVESTAYTTTNTTGVVANDTDADGDTLTASLVTDVEHGTLAFSSDGSFTYTADAEFSGTDTFTYKVNDGSADSNTATVTFTVTRQSDTERPVVTLLGDSSVSLTVNDTFLDPGATATDVRDGTVSVSVGGDSVNTDIPGTYTLTYGATDAAGNSALPVSRTVTVSSGSSGGGGGGGSSRSLRSGSVLGASTLSDEQRIEILTKILELLQRVAALRAELVLRGVNT